MPTENEVRQALGVEKEFWVDITVPITGALHIKEVVMAVTEEEALEKAKQQVLEDGPDESTNEYEVAPHPEWSAEIDKRLSYG